MSEPVFLRDRLKAGLDVEHKAAPWITRVLDSALHDPACVGRRCWETFTSTSALTFRGVPWVVDPAVGETPMAIPNVVRLVNSDYVESEPEVIPGVYVPAEDLDACPECDRLKDRAISTDLIRRYHAVAHGFASRAHQAFYVDPVRMLREELGR